MAWGFPYLKQLNKNRVNPDLQNLGTLYAKFIKAFTNAATKVQAERDMRKPFQTKSAAEYASRFQTLAMELDWGEEA